MGSLAQLVHVHIREVVYINPIAILVAQRCIGMLIAIWAPFEALYNILYTVLRFYGLHNILALHILGKVAMKYQHIFTAHIHV